MKSMLHFSKFLVNHKTILKLTKSSENQQTDVSNDILAKQKSYQIFSHELNTFLCRQCNGKSHTNKSTSKTPKSPFPLGDVDPI